MPRLASCRSGIAKTVAAQTDQAMVIKAGRRPTMGANFLWERPGTSGTVGTGEVTTDAELALMEGGSAGAGK